jgi:L-aminopeptidase/D-esterase-like protein
MGKPGPTNGLTDIHGLLVGHYTDTAAASGVTVIVCPEGAVAGVDVRGAAPGTRETDLLNPVNLAEKIHAAVLTGGSVYGLSTADGVVRRLAQDGLGLSLPGGFTAPLVPAAALFDLGRGGDYVPPIGPDWGAKAYDAAGDDSFPIGCVGAGTGAVSGGIKGGLGTASEILDNGLTAAAIVAVNSLGSAINPSTGRLWEYDMELDGEFGEWARRPVQSPYDASFGPASHTTIGVVATDAILTKPQANKIAQMAHDGLARAVRPAHTMFDGDTIFCMATGAKELPVTPGFFPFPQAQAINELGRAAADCVSRAILRAILAAHSLYGFTAFRDLPKR